MGKVISSFDLGWPGAISRSVDDIVVSLKNKGEDPIPFGVPVFLSNDGTGVVAFSDTNSGGTPQDFEKFVGFTVRSGSKTPDTYPQQQDLNAFSGDQEGAWNPGEVVEVLVRGCIAALSVAGFTPGCKVYIRKTDGSIVPTAGSEGSTVLLENVRCRRNQTGNGACNEFVITKRNIQ